MYMRRIFLCFYLCLEFFYCHAQIIPLSHCVDASLKPKPLTQLTWQSEQHFTYLSTDATQLLQGRVNSDSVRPILSLSTLNQMLYTPLQAFPQISWQSDSIFTFWEGSFLRAYALGTDSLAEWAFRENDYGDTRRSAKGHLAYVLGKNIHLYHADKKINFPITKDGSHSLEYGTATHRREFGIQEGLFWSPFGEKLAFYRTNHRAVADYPLFDFDTVPPRYTQIKYPMAGDSSHMASIGVYHTRENRLIYLRTGFPKDQYLTNVTWSPGSSLIYVAVVKRGQNRMALNQYSAENGSFVQTLFEEQHPKYVEPEHGPIFLPNMPERFLWLSEKDGYQHLYLYDTEGNEKGQLTRGKWEVTQILGFDAQAQHLYIQGTAEAGLERHLYSLRLSDGKLKRLTTHAGVHQGQLSPDGKYLLDTWSSLEVPQQVDLLDTQTGAVVRTLYQAPNPLAAYQIGNVELVTLYTEDSTQLNARLIKPADFDSTQKYPTIIYVYGGPHIQLVDRSWLGDAHDILFLHHLAAKGYVVFTLDNRGSAYRGRAFEDCIFGQLGKIELQDQQLGLDFLRAQTFVDPKRMGVYGGSFGGFMTLNMMLHLPTAFKAGVARGPVTDWRYYEVMYTERYMNTPQENPEGYANSSLLDKVGQLKGKLLLIHGMKDATVVPQHSQLLLQKALDQGVNIDFSPYFKQAHSVRGKERIRFYQEIAEYFEDHL